MRTQYSATRSGTWTQVKTHLAMEAVVASLAVAALVAAIGAWQFRGDPGSAVSDAVPSARPQIAWVGENDTSGFDFEAFEREFGASLGAYGAGGTASLRTEHDSLIDGVLAAFPERPAPAAAMSVGDLLAEHDSLVTGVLATLPERLTPAVATMSVEDLMAEHDRYIDAVLAGAR